MIYQYNKSISVKPFWCIEWFPSASRLLAVKFLSMSPQDPAPRTSRYRWVICALLFFSTTVNYLDRQVISYLKEYFCTPVAQGGFGWTNSDYANVTGLFIGCWRYAGMTIFAGIVIDKIGTKLGLAPFTHRLVDFWDSQCIRGTPGDRACYYCAVCLAWARQATFRARSRRVAEWFRERESSPRDRHI